VTKPLDLNLGGDPVELRSLETLEEFRACVRLQEETWGQGFSEKVPVSLLKVNLRLGGVSAGAFAASGELVGFVYGLTGYRDGEPLHWSDMLAVGPSWRGRGLGVHLKLYQRQLLLDQDVTRMHWTFDPLESRNAHLNFVRLGIVVREYVENMYGESNSPLHQGVGTDRFIAWWDMTSPRVMDRLNGLGPEPLRGVPDAFEVGEDGGLHRPLGTPVWSPGGGPVMVPVPEDFQEVKARDPGLAVAWREATRAVLGPAFSGGYEVQEFFRGSGVSRYLLVPRDD
jgi:predicted GNAT superfamily acetyltransferase